MLFGAPNGRQRHSSHQFRTSQGRHGDPIPEMFLKSLGIYLCVAYTENQCRDPKEITQGFAELDDYLQGISLDDNNVIFCLVCRLCGLYEQRAFRDGLQLGAHLILELQGK